MMPKGCAKSKMHRPKFQTAGWAAFDRDHREKQGIGAEDVVDPFPSISKNLSSDMIESSNCFKLVNNLLPAQTMQTRSFSSVVLPPTLFKFPSLKTCTKIGASDINNDDSYVVTVKSNANPVEMLKDVHSWADQYLIEDILAAVNNDVRQASTLLKEMTSFETKIKTVHSEFSEISLSAAELNWSGDKETFLEENSSIVDLNVSENSYKELISEQFYVPSEPEWEEDDIYLSHRKEALKKMRAGSQHSRAASNAYMRGDHLSAQQLSSRAREEWMDAKKLNAQAREEILCIRNSNNDIWKLDLHGLHATEAVYALARHLEELESIMMMNHSSSSNELAKMKQIHENSSFDSIDGFETTGYSEGNIVPQQRQTFLHVITGTGNHSKGQAALPAAVRSFLVDEGYRFDDARPGVISVRLKFRYK